jgi:hypothetical protein
VNDSTCCTACGKPLITACSFRQITTAERELYFCNESCVDKFLARSLSGYGSTAKPAQAASIQAEAARAIAADAKTEREIKARREALSWVPWATKQITKAAKKGERETILNLSGWFFANESHRLEIGRVLADRLKELGFKADCCMRYVHPNSTSQFVAIIVSWT